MLSKFKLNMTNAESSLKYKRNNKEKVELYRKSRYKIRMHLLNQLRNRPCMDCQGWFEPWQMQFDHRPNEIKHRTVTYISLGKLKTLLDEIKKCDIVCSNCHDNRTYQRLQQKKSKS